MSEQPPIYVHFAVTEYGQQPDEFITVKVEVNRFGDPGPFAFDPVIRRVREETNAALAERYEP